MTLYKLELEPVANQEFSVLIGSDEFNIRVYILQGQSGLFVDIKLNGEALIMCVRPKEAMNILSPFQHLVVSTNLEILTFISVDDKGVFNYEDLGSNLNLYYGLRA